MSAKPWEAAVAGDGAPAAPAEAARAQAGAASLGAASAGTEERAFRALFEAHCELVARVVRRSAGPEIDVDAAVQDVFLVIFRELPRFEGRAQLRTWIYRIALNVAAEHRRRAQRKTRLERALAALTFWREGAPTPSTELEARDGAARVQRFLSRLSERKRAAFVLCELEELTSEEAALVLGVPAATVRTRLFHAKKELLERFAAYGREV